MIVQFIEANRDQFGVEPICEVLQFAPSTYYAARDRAPSMRALRDQALGAVLVGIWGGQLPGLRSPQAMEGRPSGRHRCRARSGRPPDALKRHRWRPA